MPIEFRLAVESDIPVLRELIPRSVRVLLAGHYTQRQIELALGPVFGVDHALILDGTFFVAEADGAIAGCGGWSKRKTLYGGSEGRTELGELLDPAHDAALLRAFFIDPDHVRRGIGRQIIERCEAAATEAGFARMELGATIPGEALYASMGYRVTRRFLVPLADGESLAATQMEKSLRET